MGLPVAELQTAAITRYRGDATLQGLITGATAPTWNIFDSTGVPVGQITPYVVVDIVSGQQGTAQTFTTDGRDIFLAVNVLSQYLGFSEARAIAKRIDALTHRNGFTLTGGFTNFFTMNDLYQELVETDGFTHRVYLRYRCMTQG